MWQSISTAPFHRELELAVIDEEGPHLIIFPAVKYLAAGKMPKQKARSTYTRQLARWLKSANSILLSTDTIDYVATDSTGQTAPAGTRIERPGAAVPGIFRSCGSRRTFLSPVRCYGTTGSNIRR